MAAGTPVAAPPVVEAEADDVEEDVEDEEEDDEAGEVAAPPPVVVPVLQPARTATVAATAATSPAVVGADPERETAVVRRTVMTAVSLPWCRWPRQGRRCQGAPGSDAPPERSWLAIT